MNREKFLKVASYIMANAGKQSMTYIEKQYADGVMLYRDIIDGVKTGF